METINNIISLISINDIIEGYKQCNTLSCVIDAMNKLNFDFEVSEYSHEYEVTFYDENESVIGIETVTKL